MRTGRHRIQRSPLTAPASVGADLSAPRPDPGQLRPGHRLAPRLHRAPRRRRRAVGRRRGPPAAGRPSVPAHRSRHIRRWTSRPVGLDHAAHPDRADHGYRSARGRLTGARRPLADSDARPGMSASRSTPGRTPLNYLPETAVLPAAAARRSTGGLSSRQRPYRHAKLAHGNHRGWGSSPRFTQTVAAAALGVHRPGVLRTACERAGCPRARALLPACQPVCGSGGLHGSSDDRRPQLFGRHHLGQSASPSPGRSPRRPAHDSDERVDGDDGVGGLVDGRDPVRAPGGTAAPGAPPCPPA